MEIEIRKAESKDAPEIASLIRSLGIFKKLSDETLQDTAERIFRHLELCNADDSHLVLVAVDPTGEILGYGAVHWQPYLFLMGPEGYVSELFIREECRGQGIGGKILDVIKAEAEKRGCARLMLLNMRGRESYLRQFYAKHGWEERPDAANFVLHLM